MLGNLALILVSLLSIGGSGPIDANNIAQNPLTRSGFTLNTEIELSFDKDYELDERYLAGETVTATVSITAGGYYGGPGTCWLYGPNIDPALSQNYTWGDFTFDAPTESGTYEDYYAEVELINATKQQSNAQTLRVNFKPIAHDGIAQVTSNESFSFQLDQVEDEDEDDSITYTKVDGPTGVSLSSAGVLSGTLTNNDPNCCAIYTVTFTANDGYEDTDEASLTIYVSYD